LSFLSLDNLTQVDVFSEGVKTPKNIGRDLWPRPEGRGLTLTFLPAVVRRTKAARSGDQKETTKPQWALAIFKQAVNLKICLFADTLYYIYNLRNIYFDFFASDW
jgi:hypothetical protein